MLYCRRWLAVVLCACLLLTGCMWDGRGPFVPGGDRDDEVDAEANVDQGGAADAALALQVNVESMLGGPLGPAETKAENRRVLLVEMVGYALASGSQQVPGDWAMPVGSTAPLVIGPENKPLVATGGMADRIRLSTDTSIFPSPQPIEPQEDSEQADDEPAEAGEDEREVDTKTTSQITPAKPSEPTEPAGRQWVKIASQKFSVPPGCTSIATIRRGSTGSNGNDQTNAVASSSAKPLRIAIGTSRGEAAGPASLFIAADEDAMLSDNAAPESPTSREPTWLVVPWPLEQASGSFAMLVPPMLALGRTSNTYLYITISEVSDDSEAYADAMEARNALLARQTLGASGTPWTSIAAVLEKSPDDPQTLRQDLIRVLLETGSRNIGEVVVLANEDNLPVFRDAALEALASLEADAGDDALSWAVDRQGLLAAAKLNAENRLNPAGRAALAIRFGQVGRDLTTLGALAEASGTRSDFQQRLFAEHLILLEDLSPAVRVRAYEWLEHKGEAPADYDPLASATARRDAMATYMEQRSGANAKNENDGREK